MTANTVYTLTATLNYTDIVSIDAYGKDASGSFYTLSGNSYSNNYLTVKNTSAVTITEVTLIVVYSK